MEAELSRSLACTRSLIASDSHGSSAANRSATRCSVVRASSDAEPLLRCRRIDLRTLVQVADRAGDLRERGHPRLDQLELDALAQRRFIGQSDRAPSRVRTKSSGRQFLDVLLVHPIELRYVEDRGRVVDDDRCVNSATNRSRSRISRRTATPTRAARGSSSAPRAGSRHRGTQGANGTVARTEPRLRSGRGPAGRARTAAARPPARGTAACSARRPAAGPSPRITCVISIAMSSTVLAIDERRRAVGPRDDEVLHLVERRPDLATEQVVDDDVSPRGRRSATRTARPAASVRVRQKRSYPVFTPRAWTSSRVQ